MLRADRDQLGFFRRNAEHLVHGAQADQLDAAEHPGHAGERGARDIQFGPLAREQ